MKHFFAVIFIGLLSTCDVFSQYIEKDWKERDEWMKTEALLKWAGVTEGDRVADIGCHEGYLSIHLSRKVLDNGRVYSVDVREDRLETLRENANDRNLKNIITILGDYDDPKLPERELDIIFIVDTYHEITSHEKMLLHVKRSLKPGGKVMLLEKLKKRVKNKSRAEQVSAHSLGPSYVQKELEQAGFTIISKIENHGKWEREEDKQMWVLLAQKSE
ncbi:class I SAM-dependent methyltransferase [Flagellimonas hymeniacidonis]|uniref:Class I SAM-dependent methyltransferase n=1 Tax=Flagellimonas hymeniacidonis TaxID=2603628 RepID=A0A5C8V416_9FLAO|nr:class I SAM-dependent methyltransferase [Flagellimonas hymeniacidonis]TXN35725.1 class I SAM-dependent methyltransferase [Flagellimonas hymeniacidonis]